MAEGKTWLETEALPLNGSRYCRDATDGADLLDDEKCEKDSLDGRLGLYVRVGVVVLVESCLAWKSKVL